MPLTEEERKKLRRAHSRYQKVRKESNVSKPPKPSAKEIYKAKERQRRVHRGARMSGERKPRTTLEHGPVSVSHRDYLQSREGRRISPEVRREAMHGGRESRGSIHSMERLYRQRAPTVKKAIQRLSGRGEGAVRRKLKLPGRAGRILKFIQAVGRLID